MVEERIDEGTESDTTLHASEKNDSVEVIADELFSLHMEPDKGGMYFFAGKENFSIILEMDQLEDIQFDKTGPKSLLSELRNCFKNGIGLQKYSIDAEDMCDVIEISFKNANEQTKAVLAQPTIQGHQIYVHKPLGYRASYLYNLEISNVPFGDPEKSKSMLADIFWPLGSVFASDIHVTEDGSWMTGNAYVMLLANKSYDINLGKYTYHK